MNYYNMKIVHIGTTTLQHCSYSVSVYTQYLNVSYHHLAQSSNTIRYDSVCLTCSKKLTGSSLVYHTEQTKN